MEKVIPKGQTLSGLVTVQVHYDDGKEENLSFRGVRCGLHWPSANSPGFYVLVGQSTKGSITGEYPLRFLREGQGQIPSQLYEKMTNDMGAFGIEEIYADVSQKFNGYVLDFKAFKKEERPRQRILLKSAPFYEDFSHGVFVVRGWVKKDALVIPKDSLVYEQLKNIATKDLKDNPEEKFFAVNALRFVVGAFEVLSCAPLNPRNKIPSSAPPIGAFT